MQQGIDETKIPRIEGAKIAILKSRWYPETLSNLLRRPAEPLWRRRAAHSCRFCERHSFYGPKGPK
jgi:hypothetical protein